VSLLRAAPKDLPDYFRTVVRRKVDKDRTVSVNGKLYEAPLGLVGNTVNLLYDPGDPSRIEVISEERSWGFLGILSVFINSRVKRVGGQMTELFPPALTRSRRPTTADLYSTGGHSNDRSHPCLRILR
jgi:putative transposase